MFSYLMKMCSFTANSLLFFSLFWLCHWHSNYKQPHSLRIMITTKFWGIHCRYYCAPETWLCKTMNTYARIEHTSCAFGYHPSSCKFITHPQWKSASHELWFIQIFPSETDVYFAFVFLKQVSKFSIVVFVAIIHKIKIDLCLICWTFVFLMNTVGSGALLKGSLRNLVIFWLCF